MKKYLLVCSWVWFQSLWSVRLRWWRGRQFKRTVLVWILWSRCLLLPWSCFLKWSWIRGCDRIPIWRCTLWAFWVVVLRRCFWDREGIWGFRGFGHFLWLWRRFGFGATVTWLRCLWLQNLGQHSDIMKKLLIRACRRNCWAYPFPLPWAVL